MKNIISMLLLALFAGLACVYSADYGIQQIINYDSQNVYENTTDNNFYQNDFLQNNVSVYDIGYQFYKIHMILGLNMLSMSGGVLLSEDVSYMNILYELKDISAYNIMDILEFELDRATVLREYLDSMNNSIIRADFALNNLKEDMAVLQSDMDYCLSQKKQADANYIDSINSDYQYALISKNLQDSLYYGECVSDKKIKYSAKKIFSDKISIYNTALKTKYNYLFQNEDLIANNYDLIKADLLQTLLNIKKMLEKYNF